MGTFSRRSVVDNAISLTRDFSYPGGQGDIVTCHAYYGLRAYNSAYATGSNPCLDLQPSGGGTPVVINILANGYIDRATAAPLVASGYYVSKLYDHTGGGRHIGNSAAGAGLALDLSTATPFIKLKTAFQDLNTDDLGTPVTNLSNPFCWTQVADMGASGNSSLFQDFGGRGIAVSGSSRNYYIGFATGGVDSGVPCGYGSFEAQCGLANGTSASIRVNNGSGSHALVNHDLVSEVMDLQAETNSSRWLEAGLVPGDQSASFTALIAQMRSAWRF